MHSDIGTNSEPWSLVIAIEDHKGPITVEGLAAILGKSPTTIYRMAQRKQLPSHMVSGSRLFDPAALGMHFRKIAGICGSCGSHPQTAADSSVSLEVCSQGRCLYASLEVIMTERLQVPFPKSRYSCGLAVPARS